VGKEDKLVGLWFYFDDKILSAANHQLGGDACMIIIVTAYHFSGFSKVHGKSSSTRQKINTLKFIEDRIPSLLRRF
jgi:hypothetical protein